MEKEKKSYNKKWLYWLTPLVLIILLLVGGRLALKSGWLFDIVRDIAVEQANDQINGTLSIESVRGDLLNGFTAVNINLKDTASGDIANVDSVFVKYRLLSLLREPHVIEELTINGLDAYIKQEPDSSWNVMKLIDDAEDPDDSTLFWAIDKLTVNRANIDIQSELLLPDGFLNIEGLHADATAGMREQGFYSTLRELDFSVHGTRLPEPVEVFLAGSSTENRVTLESLVLNTGRTLIEANADYTIGDDLSAEAATRPLSWRDIAAYVDDLPLQQDIDMELSAEGSFENLELNLRASAVGLEHFRISTGISLGETMGIHSVEISAENFDGPRLTGIAELPAFRSFHTTGNGNVTLDDLSLATWAGNASVNGFQFDEYDINELNIEYELAEGNAQFFANINYVDERIELVGSVDEFITDLPTWRADVRSDNLNISTWLNEPDLESSLNVRGHLNGEGFSPENFTANIDLQILGNSFGDQPFSEINFEGTVDPNQVSGFAHSRIERSVVEADFNLTDWLDNPHYTFQLFLKEFNSAELVGLEEFQTYLNGSVTGEGSSFDLETLELNAVASLDSSLVNREEIQAFKTDLRISNQVLFIENGNLESPIADATFSLRQHITEFTNLENKLNFNATIKNLQPLAPLAGLEILQSEGTISGNMARNDAEILEFNGNLDLENTIADTLLTSPKITGSVVSLITDDPEVDLIVDLDEPAFFGISVQDVNFQTSATFKENETLGNVQYTITNGSESSLSQSGSFSIDSTRTFLRTHALEFTTNLRTLSLNEPFNLTYADHVLSVDSLTIATGDENSYLQLWAPHVDSLKQHIGLDARYLNVGALQSTFLDDSFFDGYLSGNIELLNSPEELTVSATGILEQFMYESGRMDSLRFSADLKDEWLDSELRLWDDEELRAETSLRVPYLPGDPLTFDDQFFDRAIAGELKIYESDITYWLSFTPEGTYEETEGRISMEGNLTGVAGNPELTGSLTVGEGLFSGIRVDSVKMDMQYLHEQENVEINGRITKDRQPILSFNAALPFLVDLQNTEIMLPSDDDEVFVDVRTDNFDLAIFNNYVDRDLIRNIEGRLQGEITLSGTIADLEAAGQMQLTRGKLRYIPAGITVEEIASRIAFRQDRIELQQFTMRSGPGTIRANGTVELENLTPGNIQIDITGNQFRAINTPVYNALINTRASLTGTTEDPRLSGSLTFLRGFVNLQNFGERAVEDVVLEDEEEPEPFEFYDSLTLDMNVNFSRQFFIRNRQYLDMEIELGGQLDLQKDKNEELQIFGQLEGVRGFARPLGKQFTLDEAVVTFYGPVDNPELNIITRFDPPQAQAGVRIFYIIEGTVEDPTFRFDSEPELELQDIVSYTLFGRPFYELDSWEQVVAGSGSSPTPADIALDVLLDRVEMIASQRFGIDVVQIDNTRSGSGSNTSIKTGWYLNQRTFFAVINEIGGARPKTLFLLEYLLMENLELLITQGDDPRQGIDLRWKKDY